MDVDKSFWFLVKDKDFGEIRKYPWRRTVKIKGNVSAFWIHESNDKNGKLMKNAIEISEIDDLIKEVFFNKRYVWLSSDEHEKKQGLFIYEGSSFINWGCDPKYEKLIKSYL